MMKRFTTLAVMLLLSTLSYAEGYQVNLQSARQTGMGHVGVAMKLGSESIYFNPAGLSSMESNFDLSMGGSAIFATIDYSNGDTKAQTDNSPSTPIYLHAGVKINDKLAAGISVTTPYGSSLNWGKNWVGADLVQDIALKAYNVQPTLSYKITDRLSVGAGLMVNFGSVEISRALLPVGSLASVLGSDYADVVAVQATLNGDAGVQLGYNVGVMYDINDRWSVGASYRSKVSLEVGAGTASLAYASDYIKEKLSSQIPPLDEGTFSAAMPLPANLTVGVAFQPCNRLLLSADLQTVFWSAYKELNIHFTEEVLGGYDINSVKNYKNTIIARVGAEYKLTERFDLRGGVYFDESPVQSDNYNPETPGMNKWGFSTGFSFRPVEFMSIDFAMLYIYGTTRTGSVDYTNGQLQECTFSGTYSSDSFAPTLGVSFRF